MALQPAYQYIAVPLRLVDADTIEVRVDLGFRAFIVTPVRLLGVNAPERDTPEGQRAIEWARAWLDRTNAWSQGLLIRSAKPGQYGDKFGRWLAIVHDAQNHCLNDDMVVAGHAVRIKG